VGILTSWNPDTPKGLKTQLSIRIHRIPAELPHSTELELGKLRRTQIVSGRASVLELLCGLPTSRKVLRPSESRLSLSLYSTNIEFGRPLGGGAKPHFLYTFSQEEYGGIYRGVKSVLWVKGALRVPTCQVGRPSRVAGRPSFVAATTFPPRILLLPT
jgi:hypothetical protein